MTNDHFDPPPGPGERATIPAATQGYLSVSGESVRSCVPDAVMSAMETETCPLPDAVASAWDAEIAPPCDCATSDGGGLHLTFVDDPGLARLHKDQMRASAIIEALMRAARDGGVSILLSLNTVTFEWRDVNDALFVFEAITERQS